jgi:hypothetical protein
MYTLSAISAAADEGTGKVEKIKAKTTTHVKIFFHF